MRDLSGALRARQLDVRRFQRAVIEAVVSSNRLDVRLDANSALVLTGVPALSVSPSYQVGQVVLLARDDMGPVVLGRLGTAVPPPPEESEPPPPVAPPSQTTERTKTVLPSWTGSYRAGIWRPDTDTVRQGAWADSRTHHGAAYYGAQLSGLGADMSKPRSIVLTYQRRPGGYYSAQTPTFYTLSGSAKPAGAPSRLLMQAGTPVAVNDAATLTLGANLVNQLLNGTAGGLGIYVAGTAPYIALSGKSDSAVSMSLKVTYYA